MLISFPTTEFSQLAWAWTLLLWMAASHVYGGPCGREEAAKVTYRPLKQALKALASVVLVAVLLKLPVNRAALWLLVSVIVPLLVIQPWLRVKLASSEGWKQRLLPGIEVLLHVLAITGTAIVIGSLEDSFQSPLIRTSTSPQTESFGLTVAAGALFLTRSATYIVRSILDSISVKPLGDKDKHEIDLSEYNRGRLIGNLERLLLFALAIVGAYEAMAFVIAIKGIARWEELKDRDFSEYFIIGSLTSILLAVVAAMATGGLRRLLIIT